MFNILMFKILIGLCGAIGSLTLAIRFTNDNFILVLACIAGFVLMIGATK